MAIAARIPMIATTIRSSMSVKPCLLFLNRVDNLNYLHYTFLKDKKRATREGSPFLLTY